MKITDHKKIKEWAQNHDTSPAVVNDGQKDTSILRFDVGDSEDELHEINWEHFFELFEENKLALIIEEDSKFNKFVSRD
jgi:hypothetical protein